MTQRSEPLKPCPFCGEMPRTGVRYLGQPFVECFRKCGYSVDEETWNRRSGQPLLPIGNKTTVEPEKAANIPEREQPQPLSDGKDEKTADRIADRLADIIGKLCAPKVVARIVGGESFETIQAEIGGGFSLRGEIETALSTARTEERKKYEPLVEAAGNAHLLLTEHFLGNTFAATKLHAALSGVNVSSASKLMGEGR